MFDVLGLCSDATLRDVRRAYRRLALVHHPDRGGDAARFREITDAFEQITQGSASGDGGGRLPQDDACSQPMARADNVRVLISTPWDLLTIDERRIWLGELLLSTTNPSLCLLRLSLSLSLSLTRGEASERRGSPSETKAGSAGQTERACQSAEAGGRGWRPGLEAEAGGRGWRPGLEAEAGGSLG